MVQSEIERIKVREGESEVTVQEIIKTHISWVLLTEHYAYKIKRPIKTSFLDYSTLQKRKYYCEKEIQLNKRLAEGIYLTAVPIMLRDNAFTIDGTNGKIVDFAVMMNKMNPCHQMDILLKAGKVTSFAIENIAKKVAHFHEKTKRIILSLNLESLKNNFNDILTIAPSMEAYLGTAYSKDVQEVCARSNAFLEKNYVLMQRRASEGYYRDCHGDLHAKNIILGKEPIIFDCIEFNDSFRQIDVLNEIAFFCMELEVMEKETLSNLFVKEYLIHTAFDHSPALENLLRYYKMYRANIRAKVVAMELLDKESHKETDALILRLRKYLNIMVAYCGRLE